MILHDLFLINWCYLLLVSVFLCSLNWSLSTGSHIVLAIHCNDSVVILLISCSLKSCFPLHIAFLHFVKDLVSQQATKIIVSLSIQFTFHFLWFQRIVPWRIICATSIKYLLMFLARVQLYNILFVSLFNRVNPFVLETFVS